MAYPPMTVEVVPGTPADEVHLLVRHHMAQSYSRAVEPRAMKEARNRLVGRWGLYDVDYDQVPTVGDRCGSVYKFRKL